MKIENIDIQATLEKAQSLIRDDKQLSPATKSMFEILILIITLLANRLALNSTNSSKPPASDPNRKRQPGKKTGCFRSIDGARIFCRIRGYCPLAASKGSSQALELLFSGKKT